MNVFAMHDAAKNGDLDRVRQLIEAGVSVDSLDEWGQTPLHVAAFYGRYEAAVLLIDSECNLDIKDRYDRTPLMGATRKDIVNLLLHRGAQVDCVDKHGWTVLHFASNAGSVDIVRLILDNGEADVNAKTQIGQTPLMRAAAGGHEKVAALLIRAGADVNRSDVRKWTALHEAVLLRRTRVIQILLEMEGLDCSPQDVNGNSPLYLSVLYKYPEAIKQLLDAEADTNVKNNRGETALNIGIRTWRLTHEKIRLFVKKGAFLESCDYECISRDPFLKENVLKDVELCTQSVVNKFNRQSLPALNSNPYFARRLPNVNNFKLTARHIDEVENLVKCEIEKNTFCNVVRVHPISLSALCVQSLITCQSGQKRAASTGLSHSPFKQKS